MPLYTLVFKVVLNLNHGALVVNATRTIDPCILLDNIHPGSGCVHAFHFAEVCSGIPYSTGLGGGHVRVGRWETLLSFETGALSQLIGIGQRYKSLFSVCRVLSRTRTYRHFLKIVYVQVFFRCRCRYGQGRSNQKTTIWAASASGTDRR